MHAITILGKPIFYDLKKGWTCCNKIVYDWDEFQALPTCATGRYEDTSAELAATKQSAFYQSNTIHWIKKNSNVYRLRILMILINKRKQN